MTTENRSSDPNLILAEYLARKIFECPAGVAPDEVQRLQFRGRGERDHGGVCEGALVCVIADALRNRP